MRVGLLTRFMGVLGIIVGVLFIVPIGSPLPIVQAFWLVALGALFLGRWPSGMPPAWVTGEAQPWPSQQELREARMEAQAERKEGKEERAALRGATGPPRAARDARAGAARAPPASVLEEEEAQAQVDRYRAAANPRASTVTEACAGGYGAPHDLRGGVCSALVAGP